MKKRYDRAYFDKWYRSEDRVTSRVEVQRKVSLAIATAEYFLGRKIRSVLDVGCGEGAWYPHLRELRGALAYTGLDPSEYVVRRFGKERNIRKASFGELTSLRFEREFDLVVCSDVLHYVPEEEIRPGILEIARLTRSIAFIEVLTAADDIIGDLDGLIARPHAWYRSTFMKAGMVQVAPYSWAGRQLVPMLSAFELPR